MPNRGPSPRYGPEAAAGDPSLVTRGKGGESPRPGRTREDHSSLGPSGRGRRMRGDPAAPRPDGGPAPVQGPETLRGRLARRAADGTGSGGGRRNPAGCGWDPCVARTDSSGAGREASVHGAGAGNATEETVALTAARRVGSCRAGQRPRRRVSMSYSSPIYCLSPAAQWGSPRLRDLCCLPPLPPPPAPGPRRADPPSPPPGTALCPSAAPLRGFGEVQEVAWPRSLRAEPAQTPAPAPEYFTVGQREGRGEEGLNPPPQAPRALISHASLQLSAARRGRPGCN